MITVSYQYTYYSPCGDLSCCSDSTSLMELLLENGTIQDRIVPIMSSVHDLKMYLEQYKEFYAKEYPGEEFHIEESACIWY